MSPSSLPLFLTFLNEAEHLPEGVANVKNHGEQMDFQEFLSALKLLCNQQTYRPIIAGMQFKRTKRKTVKAEVIKIVKDEECG